MASHYQYTYFRVSKTEDPHTSAQRYKKLRLQALKLSPLSFGSTYETEATFTDEYWLSRSTEDGRETFICDASQSSESDTPNQSSPEWVAQVTLLGPLNQKDFALSASERQSPNLEDDDEECWQMLGLYTLPSHRGRGIANRLCKEALDYIRSYRPEPKNVLVRLMVKPEMHAIIRFYEQLGFVEAGRCSVADAMVANGDRDLLPEDYYEQEKYMTPTGHFLTQRFTRDGR